MTEEEHALARTLLEEMRAGFAKLRGEMRTGAAALAKDADTSNFQAKKSAYFKSPDILARLDMIEKRVERLEARLDASPLNI